MKHTILAIIAAVCIWAGIVLSVSCSQKQVTQTQSQSLATIVYPDGSEQIVYRHDIITPEQSTYHDSGTEQSEKDSFFTLNPLDSAKIIYDRKPLEMKDAPNPAIKLGKDGLAVSAQKSGDSMTGAGAQPVLNSLFSYLPWLVVIIGLIIAVPVLGKVWTWLKATFAPAVQAVEKEASSVVQAVENKINPPTTPPTNQATGK